MKPSALARPAGEKPPPRDTSLSKELRAKRDNKSLRAQLAALRVQHRESVWALRPPVSRTRQGLPLRQKVLLRGFQALDGRTHEARALKRWREEMIHALGPSPSPVVLAQIEIATRTKALVDHVDAYLLEQVTLLPISTKTKYVRLEKRRLHLLALRQSMVYSIDRVLGVVVKQNGKDDTQDLAAQLAQSYVEPGAGVEEPEDA